MGRFVRMSGLLETLDESKGDVASRCLGWPINPRHLFGCAAGALAASVTALKLLTDLGYPMSLLIAALALLDGIVVLLATKP